MVGLWLGKAQSMPLSAKKTVSSCSLHSIYERTQQVKDCTTHAMHPNTVVHFVELVSCDWLVGNGLAQASNITRQILSFSIGKTYLFSMHI